MDQLKRTGVTTEQMLFASATASGSELAQVVAKVLESIRAQSTGVAEFDLVIVFMSAHFGRAATYLTDQLREGLTPRVLLGCTSEGVIGRSEEIEDEPAIAVIAATLPGARLVPFRLDFEEWDESMSDPVNFQTMIDAPKDTRLFVMLADPYSSPMEDVLDAFNAFYPGLPIIGGMASGARQPGGNALLLNDRLFHRGAVGVALAGDFRVDVIVSQGCRPIGRAFTVSLAERNIIMELEGESAFEQLRTVLASLPEADQQLLQNGLFVGRAIDPDQDQFGRGDFLIRGVMGGDPQSGALVIGDYIQEGETIQFHVRDQNTAQEDLEMLLMPEVFDAPPKGALLFSCNGRGTRLYDHPNGDISTIQKILGGVSLAGFFCAGEIGPIGGKNFLHGHTASMALFRPVSS